MPGMKAVPVRSEEDCVKIIHKGMSARAVGATSMNAESSRSHCLVVLTVHKAWSDGRKQQSKLCLVVRPGSGMHFHPRFKHYFSTNFQIKLHKYPF